MGFEQLFGFFNYKIFPGGLQPSEIETKPLISHLMTKEVKVESMFPQTQIYHEFIIGRINFRPEQVWQSQLWLAISHVQRIVK
jgi:hypothetical protein